MNKKYKLLILGSLAIILVVILSISTTIAFTVSVIFNYVASMRYVFVRKDDMSRRREFIIFVLLSVIGLVLNDVFMWLLVDFFFIDYRISKIITTVLVAIWNFVSRKIFLEDHSNTENA